MSADADWLRSKAQFAPDEETEARYKAIADKLERFGTELVRLYALEQAVRDAMSGAITISSRRNSDV